MTQSYVLRAGQRDYDFEAARRGTAVDPLALYAGAPSPATSCNVEALGRAYSHFLARHAERMERSGRVLGKGDQDMITRSITEALRLVQQRAWQVHEDGTLEIEGDRSIVYHVDDTGCFEKGHVLETGERAQCKSFQYWRRRHGGECKHLISRELIRLAQLFTADAAAPLVTERVATCTVGGKLLGHAFAVIAASDEPLITVQITDNRLRIASGEAPTFVNGVALRVTTVGTAKVRLEAEGFRALWSQFRLVAASIDTVELYANLDTGEIALVSQDGEFATTVQGTISSFS